jgi:hypothetical protein
MPTAEETKRYFDAHATRLAVDRLVDKSGALREVFALEITKPLNSPN